MVVSELPVGEYAALARAGADTMVSVSVFQVSSLGIAQARSYRGVGDAMYFPTDLRTYLRYPAAVAMHVIDDNGPHAVVESGGIGRYGEKTGGTAGLIAYAPDGSLAVLPLENEGDAKAETGTVQSDRPIYRPGDTISIRAILRDGSIGSYTVPVGSRHVTVRAPDGSNVYDHDRPITGFGTVAASIRLPEDAQTGSYGVSVGDSITSSIVVAAYKKPEYQIDFADAPQHVVGGSNAAFAVEAKYFFGRPAAGMNVHYTVYSETHYYAWWWGPYDAVVQGSGVWNRSDRKDVAQGDVSTGESGRGAFSFATAPTKEDADYSVQVEARDASGPHGDALVQPAGDGSVFSAFARTGLVDRSGGRAVKNPGSFARLRRRGGGAASRSRSRRRHRPALGTRQRGDDRRAGLRRDDGCRG